MLLILHRCFMLFRREKSKIMSDDKLQLTTFDYNDEAANEYAAVVEHESTQPPSYAAAETGNIKMPLTSLPSGDCPLSVQHSFGLPATPAVTQSDRDPCPPYDRSVQRPGIASTYCTTSLPVDYYQQRQHQQMIRQPRSTDDTPRWMSCTPKGWAAIGICLVVDVVIIFVIIYLFRATVYSR